MLAFTNDARPTHCCRMKRGELARKEIEASASIHLLLAYDDDSTIARVRVLLYYRHRYFRLNFASRIADALLTGFLESSLSSQHDMHVG